MAKTNQTANVLSAEIDEKVKQYLFWTSMWITVVTVVGVLVLPIYCRWYIN